MSDDPRAAALAAALRALAPMDEPERGAVEATAALLARCARPFDRDAQLAHVTASAICLGPRGVVLHRHRRIGAWLQPGGHVDPDEPPTLSAVRELAEETGVRARHLDPPLLVHVSVHGAPGGHVHHDCRWLLAAATEALAPARGESPDVAWCGPGTALARCAPDLRGALEKSFAVARRLGLPAVASWRP